MQDIDYTTDFVKVGMFMSGIDLKRVLEKEEKRLHKNFFMVPNRIFDLGLKPRDFIVYCCLLRHRDNNIRTCFPSRRLIAKECCMDRKTVDSAVENLSALGLVKKVCRHREDGTRTSNLYYVADLSMDSVTVSYQ